MKFFNYTFVRFLEAIIVYMYIFYKRSPLKNMDKSQLSDISYTDSHTCNI